MSPANNNLTVSVQTTTEIPKEAAAVPRTDSPPEAAVPGAPEPAVMGPEIPPEPDQAVPGTELPPEPKVPGTDISPEPAANLLPEDLEFEQGLLELEASLAATTFVVGSEIVLQTEPAVWIAARIDAKETEQGSSLLVVSASLQVSTRSNST